MAAAEQHKAWGKVIAKAWNDPQFKARLLADPKQVLGEHGVDIPGNVKVEIEDGGDTMTLPLPKKPAHEVSEHNLHEVMGYSSSGCCWH